MSSKELQIADQMYKAGKAKKDIVEVAGCTGKG